MNAAFGIDVHPMFVRSLLSSIDVAPSASMGEEDQDIYRALSRMLILLVEETADEQLVTLWQQAIREQPTEGGQV